MMTSKQESTLLAQAAHTGRTVHITRAPGGVMRLVVAMNGHAVHYLSLDGEHPLRNDSPCPEGQDPAAWTAKCDKVARVFEPLLADALGMPVRGRQTRHLAHLSWVAPLAQTPPGCASGSA